MKTLLQIVSLTLLLLSSYAYLIVDTDVGDDDVAAIAELLINGATVDAITTANGLSHPEAGATSCLRLLEYLATNPSVSTFYDIPVYIGEPSPLKGNNSFSSDTIKETEEIPDVYGWPLSNRSANDTGAVDFLVNSVKQSPNEVVIIALGPLTNIALAIESDPEFANNLKGLVIMGGGVFIDSNGTPNNASEWNLYIDPYSASLVFASGMRITMNGLDVTQYSIVDSDIISRLKLGCHTDVVVEECVIKTAAHVIKNWPYEDHYFYDTVAAAYYLNASIFQTRVLPIRVISSGDQEGRTIIDEDNGKNVVVSMSLDVEAFYDLLTKYL